MNYYTRAGATALVVMALVAGACRSGSAGTKVAANRSGWVKDHGADVMAVSRDLDAARQAVDKGDRPVILSTCNQLQDDLAAARKGLPAPDPSVDSALRAGLDAVAAGVPDCLQGARLASQASVTEKAQAKFNDARPKMDAVDKAIADWG